MPQHEQISHTTIDPRCLVCGLPEERATHEKPHLADFHQFVAPVRRGPVLMALNDNLIRRTRDRLLEVRDGNCHMDWWLNGGPSMAGEGDISCGTSGCIAGHMMAVQLGSLDAVDEGQAGRRAAALLGLDLTEYSESNMGLFYAAQWPARYRAIAREESMRLGMILMLNAVLSGEVQIAVNGRFVDRYVPTPERSA